MDILILNGSPRMNGSTAAMVKAFAEGAQEAGHEVTIIPVGRQKSGCSTGVRTEHINQRRAIGG